MKRIINKHNIQHTIIKQTLELTERVLHQYYFQYDKNYYQPTNGTALDSLLSSTLAEIYI